jgi:16S rRNA (guanine1207-N2)-methyltransferase
MTSTVTRTTDTRPTHFAQGVTATGAGTLAAVSGDHYFSPTPASADERRHVTVRLDGHDLEVVTASGVFSPGRVDLGTSVLLRTVPEPPASGDLLDLGCGWGPLALTLALQAPAARVWAVDVNSRALDLVRRNAERLRLPNITAATPEEVPTGTRFATIWSNPPIRIGKNALHGLLESWLPRLVPGASAYLVVQRNLGADSLHAWLASRWVGEIDVERVASAKGFRVLAATRR